jgi:hypothetical protein
VQILSGLEPTDRVIASPSAGILEGEKVQIVTGAPGVGPDTAAPQAAHTDTQQQAHVQTAENDPK